ncbi:MAG: class I SAM-dependent methyltransferase [Acidobacteriota bacterium]
MLRLHEGLYSAAYYRRIWSSSRASLFMLARKWELIARMIGDEHLNLSAAWVLDLGAGGGNDCACLRDLGFRGDRIVALDLLRRCALGARRSHPWMLSLQGDAARVPFRDGFFTVVYQSTMISSVLDDARRGRILEEAARVLAPGGIFVSYDTRYPNPLNPHTRPLRIAEIRRAFSGWSLRAHSVTGIPQLLRLLAPVSIRACRLVEVLPPLRSHLLAVARKPYPPDVPMRERK